MIPFFFTMPSKQKQADDAVERQGRMKNPKCDQTADDRRHDCGKQNRDRMDVAFVKNSENHVHDENCADEKQRQRME